MEQELLQEKYDALLIKYGQLEYEFDNLKRMVFGRKTERFIPKPENATQLNMFAGEETETQDVEVVHKEVITYERKKAVAKPHPGRAELPPHFPEEIEIIEPEEDTTGLIKIGEDRSEWIEYRAASLIKKVVIRPRYVRPQADEKAEVLMGELPSRPISGSIAGATLLAWIIVSKYVDHLPFYRQLKRIERDYKWSVHKSTMNSWFVAVCTLMEPLYEELRKKTMATDYLQADESRIKVLTNLPMDKGGKPKAPAKEKGSKQQLGWMWVLHNPEAGYVVFNYEDNRSKRGAMSTLKQYQSGYLQTDGYQSYNEIAARPEISRLGCLAHVRRKFFDAQQNDQKRSNYVLKVIQEIYAHEEKSRELTADERKAYRQEHLLPIYQALKTWLQEQSHQITPKSAIGEAFTYALNQWPTLMTIFEDGRLLIDNNAIENKIRPLALGRKNYLFAGSHQGAQRAAMMYSFFAHL